jgi:hypothetical protein
MKKAKKAMLAIICLPVMTALIAAGDQGRGPSLRILAENYPGATNISNSASDSTNPLIGVDANGKAYVVWYEWKSPRQFYFSTNSGGQWSSPQWVEKLYYDVEEAGWPSWAVSPSGACHLTYQDGKDPSLSYEIMHRAFQGGTWDATAFVSNNTSGSCYSGCAVNPIDNFTYVAWQDSNGHEAPGEWNILLRYRSPAGAWSSNQTLPVGYGYMPQIAIDAAGTAHLVWGFMHGRTLWYSKNKTPQNPNAWIQPAMIKDDVGNEWGNPKIACDDAGNAYVVWTNGGDLSPAEVFLRKINANGALGPEINISQSAADSEEPAIAVDKRNGDILIAWTEANDIYANACLGGTWTGPGNVTKSTAPSAMPSVAVDQTGRAHLVYAEMACGNWEIFYTTLSSGIRVSSPNGGEKWVAGTTRNILWTGAGVTGNVKIEYSTDNGGHYTTVAASTENDGTYAWAVPNTPSAACLVKISQASSGNPSDSSDAVFSIFSADSPAIELSRTKLSFGSVLSGQATSAQSVMVSNSGGGELNWIASSAPTWITLSSASGSAAGTIQIGINSSGIGPGDYSGSIIISDPNAINSPQTISVSLTVYAAGASSLPFGTVDTPADGVSGIEGSLPVTGWALDDIEVTGVKIWRDPTAGEPVHPNGYVYLGDAVFVEGARPDVEQAYPNAPLNTRAGWGFMILTNYLPNQGNGTFRVHAIAYDREGNSRLLGSKVFTCDNAHATLPFGTIDTPGQGATASGSAYVNFAWALTPQPKSIPIDGSTILVWVDGLPLGHPAYNSYRSDIATLFPGYANSNGAIGHFFLDTTSYSNGIHNIAWSVSDSAGATSGIGSRFFMIMNTGGGSATADGMTPALDVGASPSLTQKKFRSVADIEKIPTNRFLPVFFKLGFDTKSAAEMAYPGPEGILTLGIPEVQRVAVCLEPPSLADFESAGIFSLLPESGVVSGAEKPWRDALWVAYLVAAGELRPLPVGSSFDRLRGVFYWQPGPGFIGRYEFVFIKMEGPAALEKIALAIDIKPKR